MPRTDISTSEVGHLLGLSCQALHRWVHNRIIECDTPATGCGSRRRWTLRDLAQAQIALEITFNDGALRSAAIINARRPARMVAELLTSYLAEILDTQREWGGVAGPLPTGEPAVAYKR